MKIVSVVGARPQFIKHAPLEKELSKQSTVVSIHTGQHYDKSMSNIFFKQLGIKEPDYRFDLSSGGGQGAQTGEMLRLCEEVLIKEKPQFVLLYGDTNSTLAGALAAVKLHIPIIHVEAGLRSYNMEMPEEVNRIVADRFSKLLFCTSGVGVKNLSKEGIVEGVFVVGDIMRDTLEMVKPFLSAPDYTSYYFATFHRPYNVDNAERLKNIFDVLNALPNRVVLPLHPRTRSKLSTTFLEQFANITFIEPVGYIESLSLQRSSLAVITDSGGIQKEAYWLKKKCITVRTETEWVETLDNGWNTLIFNNLENLPQVLAGTLGTYNDTLYGTGAAAKDIARILNKLI
jgi:UDP-GlcNAc3NAcA epimerase